MGKNKYVTVNRQKLQIDGNGLRSPTQVEIQRDGYPTSIEDAANKGLNKYQDKDGIVQKMRYRNKAKLGAKIPNMQIQLEQSDSRDRDRVSYRATLREQDLRQKDYVEVFGEEIGKPLFRQERDSKHAIKKTKKKTEHVDHIKPLSKGGIDGSRNQINLDAFINMSQGNKRDLNKFKERSLGIEATTRHDYIGTHGPWATTEMNEKILNGEITENSPKLPKRINSKRLFRNLASVAGQSNNPLVNIGGDLVGAVIDGVSYMGDPSRERAIDVLLSTGQAVTSLGAVGLALVPIPGSRFAGYALMKVGDNIGKAERIWNLAREGAIRDTKKIRGGSIEPWKIK